MGSPRKVSCHQRPKGSRSCLRVHREMGVMKAEAPLAGLVGVGQVSALPSARLPQMGGTLSRPDSQAGSRALSRLWGRKGSGEPLTHPAERAPRSVQCGPPGQFRVWVSTGLQKREYWRRDGVGGAGSRVRQELP